MQFGGALMRKLNKAFNCRFKDCSFNKSNKGCLKSPLKLHRKLFCKHNDVTFLKFKNKQNFKNTLQ